MTGRVVRDYFMAFCWSNIKASFNLYLFIIYAYLFGCLPVLNSGIIAREKVNLLRLTVISGLAMFIVLVAVVHPVAMPKIMFLCPLSRAQRREYIRKAWLLKIAVPITMSVILMSALIACGQIDFFGGIQITAAMGVLAISTSTVGQRDAGKQTPGKERRNIWEMTKDGWIVAAMIASSMITAILLSIYSADDVMINATEKIVIAAGCAIVELPLTIQVLRRIVPKLTAFADYEGSSAGV